MRLAEKLIFSLFIILFVGSAYAESRTVMHELSYALDPGRRRGIVFSLDVGAARVSTDAINPTWNVNEYKAFDGGSGNVIGIGYAPLDQVVIMGTVRSAYYGENSGWAWALGPFGSLTSDYHVMVLVGAKFYLRRAAPSWFAEFGYGAGGMSNPLNDEPFPSGELSGPAYFVGAGYEFLPHLQFEIGVMSTSCDMNGARFDTRWESTTVMATIGVMAY